MSDDAAGSARARDGPCRQPIRRSRASRRSTAALSASVQHFLHAYPTIDPVHRAAARRRDLRRSSAPGKFLSPLNLSVVLQQVTIIAILGIAQTLVILTAGIDLSVGVIMILCSVVMGRTAVVYGVPVAIAFPLGLLVGLACGCVNGADRHAAAAAAVHRDARHLEHLRRAQHLLFATARRSARRTSRRRRRSCCGPARSSSSTTSG